MAKTTRLRVDADAKREFARRLVRRLAEIDMNQADLARATGLSKDAISTYARGRSLPTDESFEKISEALQVEKTELLPNRYDVPQGMERYELIMRPGEEKARLRIDADVDLEVGVEVLSILKKAGVKP